jgi:hypothetical protein
VQATGFVHGPASLTSTAGQASGVLQLVSPTQVYRTLLFPEVAGRPLFTRLTITLLPEPGFFLVFASGGALLCALGWRHRR